MDFFEHQERARRSSALIIALFVAAAAAVLAFMTLVGLMVHVVLAGRYGAWDSLRDFLDAPLWVYGLSVLAALGVIALGSWVRILDFEGGGVGLARMIGARRANRGSGDLGEQQLLNVVEEMAIAAGVNVPEVFVLQEERSINALAAGYAPNEAVLIVTRGLLERLDRDEMQGAVAHEFSHLLNGDIRLNMQIACTIAGIVLIGGIGRAIAPNCAMFWIGVPLWLIGSVGTLGGRVIRAAVARQREFLADAAAVQFTRNPAGIAGALYKMDRYGGLVSERHAAELSHMYLGEPMKSWFGWLQTHPPLRQRIDRIAGRGWRPALPGRVAPAAAAEPAAPRAERIPASAAALLGSVGQPSTAHVELARRILAQLPPQLRAATGDAEGAAAVLFALLLAGTPSRAARMDVLGAREGAAGAAQADRFATALEALGPAARMPLFELLVPTLRAGSDARRARLLDTAFALVGADRRASLGDFVLLTLCKRHLGAAARRALPVKHRGFASAATPVTRLLSLLVHAAKTGSAAFERAMAELQLGGQRLVPAQELSFAAVEEALYELKLLAPLRKPRLIKACLGIVIADGQVTSAEGELMRAVCAAIDSPLPPLLEG